VIDENKLMHNIIKGSDWQTVLTDIIAEENMNPWNIDLIGLTDRFVHYLERLRSFDFRIPARFILIAAILLRMKCEFLLEEEKEKAEKEQEMPDIDLDSIPNLEPPIMRKATRKVTLDELVSALNKAFVFKEKKEVRKLRMRRAVETLIEQEEDIEGRIKNVMIDIRNKMKGGRITFASIVPSWTRKNIVTTFIPLLYLEQRGSVECDQPELFGDIFITFRSSRN
jgi:segregation and condensation protein A